MRDPKVLLEPREASRTTLPAGEHFILVELPQGIERLEPLIDLTASGASFWLRRDQTDIRIGDRLPRARVFLKGHCTLDAPAVVRSVRTHDEEGLVVGIALDSTRGSHQGMERIDDPERLEALLQELAAEGTVASLIVDAVAHVVLPVRFGFTNQARLTVALLHPRAEDLRHFGSLAMGRRFDLVCELYGTRITLAANYLQLSGHEVWFKRPSFALAWRDRSSHRLSDLPIDWRLRYVSPFDNRSREASLVDLSMRGAAFVVQDEDALIVGMEIGELDLTIAGERFRTSAIVRNLRRGEFPELKVGVEFLGLGPRGHALEELISARVTAHTREVTIDDLPALWRLMDQTGLVPRSSTSTTRHGRMETTRRILVQRGRKCWRQVVLLADGQYRGAAEAIQLYPVTWTLQHCVTNPGFARSRRALFASLIDRLSGTGPFRFWHAFLSDRDLGPLDDWAPSLAMTAGLDVRRWCVLNEPLQSTFDRAEGDITDARGDRLAWVNHRLHERGANLWHEALDLVSGSFEFPTIASMYQGLTLDRRRRVRVFESVSGPIGFSLVEQSSAGLNFRGYADLSRLFVFPSGGRAHALHELAVDAWRLQRAAGYPQPKLLVPARDRVFAEEAGLTVEEELVELVAPLDRGRQLMELLTLHDHASDATTTLE